MVELWISLQYFDRINIAICLKLFELFEAHPVFFDHLLLFCDYVKYVIEFTIFQLLLMWIIDANFRTMTIHLNAHSVTLWMTVCHVPTVNLSVMSSGRVRFNEILPVTFWKRNSDCRLIGFNNSWEVVRELARYLWRRYFYSKTIYAMLYIWFRKT